MKDLLIDEKGQAIAEMAVCMIAIMAVFLAVILSLLAVLNRPDTWYRLDLSQ